jgi:REP element-mobilizing transposase RayT
LIVFSLKKLHFHLIEERERESLRLASELAGSGGDIMVSIVGMDSKNDHTTMIIPLPVRSAKSSIVGQK